MMKRILNLQLALLTFGLLAWSTSPGHTKDYLQNVTDHGFVNWTKGEIVATGMGMRPGKDWTADDKINAHRAATVDAMRRLVEIMHGIQVDSHTQVVDYIQKDDTLRTKVEGIARNFSERDVRFSDEGVCEVDLVIPLNDEGGLSSILFDEASSVELAVFQGEVPPEPTKDLAMADTSVPEVETVVEEAPVIATPEVIEETEASTTEETIPIVKQEPIALAKADKLPESHGDTFEGTVSGLVVNATGHDITPALCPMVVTESGNEIYGVKKSARNFRKRNGMASYAADLGDARLDKRVTENPYILKALAVKEGEPCVIVVGKEEAEEFIKLAGSEKALRHCRVIIVTKEEESATV